MSAVEFFEFLAFIAFVCVAVKCAEFALYAAVLSMSYGWLALCLAMPFALIAALVSAWAAEKAIAA